MTDSVEKDTNPRGSRKYARSGYASPIDAMLEVIGGKYKVAVLYHLRNGPLRFSALHRLVPAATQRTITSQLRELEADGLISRKIFRQIPPRVEYALTKAGTSLLPILEAMCEWGKRRMAKRPEKRSRSDPSL
jgi:DNA-binding HxlR family transcriptional regulator